MREKTLRILAAMLLCTLALIVLPVTAAQAKTKAKNTGKAGKNATWSYDAKKKVLTISGKGKVKVTDLKKSDKDGEMLWLGKEEGILPMFKKIVFEEGISTIDQRFFCLENVKTISLPKSFKRIQYCNIAWMEDVNGKLDPWSTTLKKIVVHKKNKKFKSSNGILLSKNGKKLYVFPSGKKADSYKVPNKVTEIGAFAFWGADVRKVAIGNKVTKIEENAFCNSTLKEVVFGKRVKRIGAYAFQSCLLSQLKLPESLTYIDVHAFEGCPLTELTIPSQVAKIRFCAFADNHKLKKIVIQGSTDFEGEVFLESVYYPASNEGADGYVVQPVTVVLGKNMKANLNTLCIDLGSKITFQVENGNPKYYVKDGNLYNIRDNKLIYEREKEIQKTETLPADTATGGAVQI